MPNGGESHIYSYYWRKSINNSTWTSAPNSVITDTSYQPDTTSIKLYFKRIVKSGLHDCCIDTSSVFTIGIHELPTDIITVFNDSLCLDSTYIIHHKLTGQPDFKIGYTDGTSNYDTSGVNVFNFDQPFRPQTAKKLNYSVTSVIDGNNCIAKKIIGSGILSVFNNPKANISGTKDSVCERVVKLDAHPSYGTGIWKSYDGVTFDNNVDSATSATAPDYGQYSVTWSENNGGCIDSAEIKISFFEQPKQSEVIVGENQEGPFKFRTTLNATSPSIGKGIWSSPDNSIYFDDRTKPKTFVDSLKFGINYFIWTITNGVCVPVWDTLKVTTNDIKVPHGFSPNLDAINDTFKILGLEYTKNSELTILNKWGGVVYQSGDYKNDWTGTYKGNALPEDTYFYILNVKKINRIYKGFLVIRR
jgi:gliding motility-associated-like protein